MPELPEVEVVRAGLAPAVSGAGVASVTVYDERSLRRHDGPSEDFIDRLTGRRMLVPERRGKFLWIPLAPVPEVLEGAGSSASPTEALVIHLGMSGQVLLRDQSTDDALTRIRLDLDTGYRLNFVDQRIFGSMAIDTLVPTVDHPDQLVPSQVAHIARDLVDPLFDDRRFLAALKRKNTTIKRALLDQTLVSGIGNIYADETLWRARVHPETPASLLSVRKARELLGRVREVFAQALAEGGTSFDAQYVNVNGQAGYFAHSLNAYGRTGAPCPRCGTPIRKITLVGRSSHFCPRCQRKREQQGV